jgi:hypothetical protein
MSFKYKATESSSTNKKVEDSSVKKLTLPPIPNLDIKKSNTADDLVKAVNNKAIGSPRKFSYSHDITEKDIEKDKQTKRYKILMGRLDQLEGNESKSSPSLTFKNDSSPPNKSSISQSNSKSKINITNNNKTKCINDDLYKRLITKPYDKEIHGKKCEKNRRRRKSNNDNDDDDDDDDDVIHNKNENGKDNEEDEDDDDDDEDESDEDIATKIINKNEIKAPNELLEEVSFIFFIILKKVNFFNNNFYLKISFWFI